MQTRLLSPQDRPALEALLAREAAYNVFHLSALAEHGLATSEISSWAVGAYHGGELAGAVMALRGTGGIYHAAGAGVPHSETLNALAEVVKAKAREGRLTLLSGHASQIDPLLPLIEELDAGQDRCHFRTLRPTHFTPPQHPPHPLTARLATPRDIERLIDFYQVGFYSLAKLPTRAAWRNRLTEQLAFRTLYLVEDPAGKVLSAALSSAEAGATAILGGVATLYEHRGQGLSTICVAALCHHLFSKGLESISLFYLKDNHPAQRVYDRLGFREAGNWLLVGLEMGRSGNYEL